MKWLAVAAAVVVAALLGLWYQARSPGTSAAAANPPEPAAVVVRHPDRGAPPGAAPADDDAPLPANVRPAGTLAPEDDPGPIKKYSEPFWERVDETYSRRLLEFASDCYHGGKERKQKLKLAFRFDIAAGKVSVRDVRVVESTLGDPALEACMTKAVAAAAFDDPDMPDWSSSADEEETLLIRISTLKRFGPQTD